MLNKAKMGDFSKIQPNIEGYLGFTLFKSPINGLGYTPEWPFMTIYGQGSDPDRGHWTGNPFYCTLGSGLATFLADVGSSCIHSGLPFPRLFLGITLSLIHI